MAAIALAGITVGHVPLREGQSTKRSPRNSSLRNLEALDMRAHGRPSRIGSARAGRHSGVRGQIFDQTMSKSGQ